MNVADGGVSRGNVVLDSGTMNTGTSAETSLGINHNSTGAATFTVNGGTLNLNTNSNIRFSRASASTGTNTFSLNGGVIQGQTGNVNGVASLTSVLDMNQAATGAAHNTFNLNGGTLHIGQVLTTQVNNADGSRIFNFNGGTLKAAGDTTAFFNLGAGTGTGTARANVRNGGALIASNGFDVTISEALLTSNISGDNAVDGGLTKQGEGTLTLAAANTYTGATRVNGGTLALGSTGSIANSAALILNGGNFNVSAATGFTLGASQTLQGSGSITGNITVNGTLAIGNTTGIVTFNNDLSLGSDSISNFDFTNIGLSANDFDLAQSGTGIQTVNFGGTLNLLFSGGTYANNSTVRIFDFENYVGSFSSVNFSGLAADQAATFDSSNGWVTVIPEPQSVLFGGLGLLSLLRRRRSPSGVAFAG
jgi:autotransporter-associated beta strand protein